MEIKPITKKLGNDEHKKYIKINSLEEKILIYFIIRNLKILLQGKSIKRNAI